MDRTERTALLISLLAIPLILLACVKYREMSTVTPMPPHTDAPHTAPEPAPTSTTTTSTTTTTTTAPPATTTTVVVTTTTVAPKVLSVTRGISHACSWGDGRVVCWGSNIRGELGGLTNGSQGIVTVEGLPKDIDNVQAADHTTCAHSRSGRAWCWGYRLGGGSGESPNDAPYPSELPLQNTTHVSVGTSGQVCAATEEVGVARIYCWGDGWSHEGTGGFDGAHFTSDPVLVWEGRHVHELQVGYRKARAHVGFSAGGCGWIEWGEGRGYGVVVGA